MLSGTDAMVQMCTKTMHIIPFQLSDLWKILRLLRFRAEKNFWCKGWKYFYFHRGNALALRGKSLHQERHGTAYLIDESLRLKEKGDWRQLTCEEKKQLYRASFCQTFSEFQYFTGSWMFCVGWSLIILGFAFWEMIIYHFYVQNEEQPKSLTPRSKSEQLRRMIDLRVNVIDGLGSLWNYKDDCWRHIKDE